ncbi:MAG: DUF4242 domain-containing protein [Flammeovirgaceae bacterium]|jgi:hypothetical protein|nr:DUF4242 domain-containing protein [Flammeovirgaceae bacterium]|tara:strand:- start:3563 stop:3835 length:273 start_codon:yes stop_codon:yes gene_type:complete
MKKYIIRRNVPNIGKSPLEARPHMAEQSCIALDKLGTKIKWIESYVVENGSYCVYLAESIDIINKHAELSGFPADEIIEVKFVLEPSMRS